MLLFCDWKCQTYGSHLSAIKPISFGVDITNFCIQWTWLLHEGRNMFNGWFKETNISPTWSNYMLYTVYMHMWMHTFIYIECISLSHTMQHATQFLKRDNVQSIMKNKRCYKITDVLFRIDHMTISNNMFLHVWWFPILLYKVPMPWWM